MIYVLAIFQGVTAVATMHPGTPSATIVSLDQARPSGVVLAGQAAPRVIAAGPPGLEMTPITVAPIHVRVTAAGRLLLNDTFRVAPTAGASYQESRSEAPDAVCAGDRYSSQERYALNVNLYVRDNSTPQMLINVTVSWQRPSQAPSCGGDGTRQVQLTQAVPLGLGQSVTIDGDAGLQVTLTR